MIVEVQGRPLDLHPYYPHCETVEPAVSVVWGGELDYRVVFGPASAEPPFPLWWTGSIVSVPEAIHIIGQIGETPCTRWPEYPHRWYAWEWRQDE